MKKAFAIIMALVLVFSLSISAFAATTSVGTGDGSITVTNAINGVNYKLYKIFDAKYKADPNPDADGDGTLDVVSYSLQTSSPVYNKMFNGVTPADGKLDNGYFVYEVATRVVTKKSGVADDAIIAYLTDLVREMYDSNDVPDPADGCFVANLTASEQKVEFTNLAYGYYLIDTENALDATEDKAKIAVTITTNTPDVNVIEKNQVPGQVEKTAEDTNVSVGDTIDWTVTFTATNYAGEKKVEYYVLTDTQTQMIDGVNKKSQWADVNTGSIVVKVGSTPLTQNTDWYLVEVDNAQFKIVIPWMEDYVFDNATKTLTVDGTSDFKFTATENVTVTYSAVVLDTATGTTPDALDNKNNADLDWDTEDAGNIPGDNDDEPGDDDDTETVIHNMGFTKVDDKGNKLKDVKFELYKEDGTTSVTLSGGTNGIYTVDPAGANNEIVTPADGQVVIMGLAAGKYVLKETETLDGYNKLGAPLTVEVGNGDADTMTINGVDYTVSNLELNIVNYQGVELPETGGKGTIMMITFGTMIAIGFAVLLITQKKMTIYND